MRWLAPWVVIGVLSGCVSVNAGQGGASPRVLFTSAMCGSRTHAPQVTWIDTPADLQRVLERFRQRQPSVTEPPPPDFTRRAAVLLEMGVQPSPGYGLTLQAGRWNISDDTLVLHVNWLTPSPGRVYPQVIVHPCLLIGVPRGGYRHIEVRDQHGALRMRGDTVDKQ